MSDLKTKPTGQSVTDFLNAIADERRRQDCFAVLEMMREVSGAEPEMWGPSIVGFGNQRYRYESGREGDWFLIGFSPRKQNLTLYLTSGLEQHAELLAQLGKHSTGKSCLYIKRLADIDMAALRELARRSIAGAAAGGA